MKKIVLERIKETRIQLCSIIFTMIYMAVLAFIQTTTFKSTEQEPLILNPTTMMQNLASKVVMGLHIESFPNFNFSKNLFTINGIVWFRFPIGTENLKTIQDFSIQNSVMSRFSYVSKPIIKLIDNDVLVSFHVELDFKANIDYKLFPIGDHRLFIIIGNKSITPHEILFDCPSENVTLSKDLLTNDWQAVKVIAKSGYINAALSEKNKDIDISYPCTLVAIDFQNIGIGDIVSLFFPMFVLFFIILFSLTIDILDISRLNLIATSVPILVLFRMVITSSAPVVGYVTQVDFVYYLLVLISLLILLFQTYVTLTAKQVKDAAEADRKRTLSHLEKINSYMIFCSLACLIIPLTINTYQLLTVYSLKP